MAAPAQRGPWWQSRQFRLAIGGVMSVAGILIFFLGRGDTAQASGEILLEAADSPGADTFTPSVAEPKPANLSPTATTQPAASSGGLVRANGASPGLYGGMRDVPSCNAERLVSYLEANPDRARPWAQASGIKVEDIRAYVATLTPAITRVDTRVTDFGFSAGKPVPRQSVLEAGTAVFLDRNAFPRLRCVSGNPLAEPQAVSRTPRYQGQRWPRFSPTTIVVITPAPPVVILILVDSVTGLVFARIPGSIVLIDIERPPAGVNLAVVPPGGRANITGSNWPPGTTVTITFDNPAADLGTATADGGGAFATQVTVPVNAAIGPHQVTIAGGGFTTTQPVYVIPRGVPRVRVRPA